MEVITVDISSFRNRLSDYLTLVNLGKAVVSVKNAKSGKEIVRVTSPIGDTGTIEKRIRELREMAGFASGSSFALRKKFLKMNLNYIKKLKKGHH